MNMSGNTHLTAPWSSQEVLNKIIAEQKEIFLVIPCCRVYIYAKNSNEVQVPVVLQL